MRYNPKRAWPFGAGRSPSPHSTREGDIQPVAEPAGVNAADAPYECLEVPEGPLQVNTTSSRKILDGAEKGTAGF